MSCDFWMIPIRIEITEGMKTVYDLLDEYKDFLDGTDRLESFEGLCCAEPEAARAEAVAYFLFKWNGYNMRVEETPDRGGVDFRAQKHNAEFVIEVKSILRETFTEHSRVPENPWASGGVFRPDPYRVAHLVRSEASGAVVQMSRYNCPRILIIACEHSEFSIYLKRKGVGSGAEIFLTSPPVLALPNLDNVTYLDNSLFFKLQNGRIVFCRESISAVLLFYISKYHAQTTGLLHPQPVHNFSIEFLPLVPFVEVPVPAIEDCSTGDVYRIRPRWIPDNLPDGFFVYNNEMVG